MGVTKTAKSFIDQFVAMATGDDAKATAEKVFRQRTAGLKTHLSNAEGNLVDKEEAVTSANEAVTVARLNRGSVIEDRDMYVRNLISRKESVLDAKESLASHKALIASLQEELDM